MKPRKIFRADLCWYSCFLKEEWRRFIKDTWSQVAAVLKKSIGDFSSISPASSLSTERVKPYLSCPSNLSVYDITAWFTQLFHCRSQPAFRASFNLWFTIQPRATPQLLPADAELEAGLYNKWVVVGPAAGHCFSPWESVEGTSCAHDAAGSLHRQCRDLLM